MSALSPSSMPFTSTSTMLKSTEVSQHTLASLSSMTGPSVLPLLHFQHAHPEDKALIKDPRSQVSLSAVANEALRLTESDSLSVGLVDIGTKPLALPQASSGQRLNRFVRLLHDMLVAEKDSGIVEWRRGLLVLHSTDAFAKQILPRYFQTKNFKTFRRQLNYYGFVHVRSFSTTGSSTTALWVNRDLAQRTSSDDVSSVLMLKRVEPCESAKTAEGRRVRKEQAIHTVEEDLGVNAKSLQMEQIRSMAMRSNEKRTTSPTQTATTTIEEVCPPGHNKKIGRTVSHSSDMIDDDTNADAANLLLMLAKG